jgi:hypothetical protein
VFEEVEMPLTILNIVTNKVEKFYITCSVLDSAKDVIIGFDTIKRMPLLQFMLFSEMCDMKTVDEMRSHVQFLRDKVYTKRDVVTRLSNTEVLELLNTRMIECERQRVLEESERRELFERDRHVPVRGSDSGTDTEIVDDLSVNRTQMVKEVRRQRVRCDKQKSPKPTITRKKQRIVEKCFRRF